MNACVTLFFGFGITGGVFGSTYSIGGIKGSLVDSGGDAS